MKKNGKTVYFKGETMILNTLKEQSRPLIAIILLGMTMVFFSGCTKTERTVAGAAIGAGAGVALGAATGGAGGAVAGGLIGGSVGGIIGNQTYKDDNKKCNHAHCNKCHHDKNKCICNTNKEMKHEHCSACCGNGK